jgi:spore coat protein CotF
MAGGNALVAEFHQSKSKAKVSVYNKRAKNQETEGS